MKTTPLQLFIEILLYFKVMVKLEKNSNLNELIAEISNRKTKYLNQRKKDKPNHINTTLEIDGDIIKFISSTGNTNIEYNMVKDELNIYKMNYAKLMNILTNTTTYLDIFSNYPKLTRDNNEDFKGFMQFCYEQAVELLDENGEKIFLN